MKHLLCLTLCLAAAGQDTNERLKKNLKDNSLVGAWFYDDLNVGTAEAKATGKPIMVVFRCVP